MPSQNTDENTVHEKMRDVERNDSFTTNTALNEKRNPQLLQKQHWSVVAKNYIKSSI